jgi:iron complex outermembrane receptor protein
VNEEIARIEVLRGPAAAMYGPDAVGGLINIVTKTFAGNNEPGTDLAAEIGIGSNGQVLSKASVSLNTETFSGNIGIQYNKSKGEEIPQLITSDNTTLDAYRNYFDIRTLGGALSIRLKNNVRLKLRSSYDYRDFSARYFYTSSTFDKSTETTTGSFNVLQLEKIRERSSSDLQLGYKYNTDEFIFSPDFASTNFHKTHLLNLLTNHLWDLSDQLILKIGGQLDRRSILSNDRGDHQDWHGGIYAIGHYKPVENLNITTSLRADYDQNYDFELLPQFNISYLLDDFVLRGSVGRSIRAADYTERYVSNNLTMLTPGRSLGNPNLLAEGSWSEEIGFDFRITGKWQLKTTGFLRQSSQLIDYVLTNETEIGSIGDLQAGEDYFFAKNITSVKTKGFEIESTFQQRFGIDNSVRLTTGYTHQTTTNEDGIVSVYIANHARDLLTISSMIEFDRFRFSLGGLYKNRNARLAQSINSQLESDYWLWNVKISLDVLENLSLNLQVQNLFNEEYQNILGAPMPHRWFSGTVGWRL